jgi:hypothetical protein
MARPKIPVATIDKKTGLPKSEKGDRYAKVDPPVDVLFGKGNRIGQIVAVERQDTFVMGGDQLDPVKIPRVCKGDGDMTYHVIRPDLPRNPVNNRPVVATLLPSEVTLMPRAPESEEEEPEKDE